MTFTPPDKYGPRARPGPDPAPPLWTAASPLARRGTSPGAARPSGCAHPLEQRGPPSPAPRSPPPPPQRRRIPPPPLPRPLPVRPPFGCACPPAGLHDPPRSRARPPTPPPSCPGPWPFFPRRELHAVAHTLPPQAPAPAGAPAGARRPVVASGRPRRAGRRFIGLRVGAAGADNLAPRPAPRPAPPILAPWPRPGATFGGPPLICGLAAAPAQGCVGFGGHVLQ